MTLSRTELAYARLKALILDLELRPGELVTEKHLMALTECGRTPVREAMQRHAAPATRRLLQVVAFRGAFIAEISAKDVGEIGDVRELLESFAANLAARLLVPRDLERLQGALDGLEPLDARTPHEIFEADRAFHAIIVEASGHKRIREIIGTLGDQIQRLRYLSAARPERALDAHREHRAIAAALLARDPTAAEAAMRLHLRHSRESLLHVVGYHAQSP